ncbi:bacillithiol biosynthesis deacetylase BshB1 [Bacillus solitudinis]|uniref:bacillithiol biosynthesis deacetylase BshB1 n=1 Tax=Bacillus solitudinis TaxID=2014074 RepID=UPI000C23D3FF|nr:bacillithiol biosynthesis deacetylase BshB1 [Bacillus solitudinis]
MTKLDILAFGAHPDDVEIGMGGTLAKYSEMGYKVGICDLTFAELSSNGTVAIRQEEAKKAGAILGIKERIQLDFPDRGLKYLSKEDLRKIVAVIRKFRPKLVFSPYGGDRHPDHGECSKIVKEAVFNAGIRNYQCTENLDNHRVKDTFHFFINGYERPDFFIDISEHFTKKERALQAYESQFVLKDDSVVTPLTTGYLDMVEARERLFAKEAGVHYAEGFKVTKPLLLKSLME